MHRLKILFVSLILVFSFSFPVFAEESTASPELLPPLITSQYSEEQIDLINSLFVSDIPYLGFFVYDSETGDFLRFSFFFEPENITIESNGSKFLRFRCSTCLSFLGYENGGFNLGISREFSENLFTGVITTGSEIPITENVQFVTNIEPSPFPEFSHALPDETIITNEDISYGDYPYGVNFRDGAGELFAYFSPVGDSVPTVTEIAVNAFPSLIEYQEGDSLDFSDMSLSVYRDDDTVEVIPYSDFAVRGVSLSPENGSVLESTLSTVSVSYDGCETEIPVTVASLDDSEVLLKISESLEELRYSVSLLVFGIIPVCFSLFGVIIFLRWFFKTFISSVI